MKLDLSTIMEMIAEQDNKTVESKSSAIVEKVVENKLEVSQLFKLFEEIEPTLNVFREDETENLEGFKNVEMVLKVPRAHLTSKMGNRGTEDYKYFAQLIRGLTGGNPTPVGVFKKIEELQQVLIQGRSELSISQNVSAMVLMEAIYSFFNGFYSIGSGDKAVEGSRLGYFAESLAVALYGAVGTIPRGFANSRLFSLADFFDPSGENPIPVSLKTTKKLTDVGSKFFLLHDLVKYKKIYFDLVEKQSAGSGNIYRIFFKRHEVILEKYKASPLEQKCIEELQNIYAAVGKTIGESSQQDASENENQESKFDPEFKFDPNLSGNLGKYLTFLQDYSWLLSLYYSGQVDTLRDSWNNLITWFEEGSNKGVQFFSLQEVDERRRINAANVRAMQSALIGRQNTNPKEKDQVKKLLESIYGRIAPGGKLLTQEQLEEFFIKSATRNMSKSQYGKLSDQRRHIFTYILTYDNNNLYNKILENTNDYETMKNFLLTVIKNYPPAYPKIQLFPEKKSQEDSFPQLEPIKLIKVSLEVPQEEPKEILGQMDIFKKQYPNLSPSLDQDTIDRVKESYDRYANQLKGIEQQDLGEYELEISLDLSPERLQTIFQNANDSLEKNYRDLVGKLNQVSELMNKYFLSPQTDPAVGNELKNNAKQIPDIAEKAIPEPKQ